MPSFDIVSEVNQQEVKNAIEQANKEITNRYDFKGSDARIEEKELELSVFADDQFKLGQVMDVLRNRLAKRNVDVRSPSITWPSLNWSSANTDSSSAFSSMRASEPLKS